MNESSQSFITLVRGDFEKIESPVRFLWPHACVRLKRLSPGVKEMCIHSVHRINLNLTDDRRFICRVEPASGRVEISTGVLSFLWACSHLNMAFYSLIRDADPIAVQTDGECVYRSELEKAFELVGWSLDFVFGEDDPGTWPSNLPRPEPEFGASSPVFATSGLALGALGFIILHEIAHVLSGHGGSEPGKRSHEQEFEADQLAVDLFLDGASTSGDSTLNARQLDIVTVMFALCLNPLLTRRWSWKTHPPQWQRLDRVIARMNMEDGDLALIFARQIKNLYSVMSGREFENLPETPTESLNRFFDRLSEE